MHLKRKAIPKFWPVQRTGTKYLAVSDHEKNSSIPLVVALRDVLKVIKNKKELKMLLNEKKVTINGKIIGEVNYPICLFDSIGFPSIKKYYRASIKDKKMDFQEISEKESTAKVYKIIGKKVLPNKKQQLNLTNGKNLLSAEKANVGDFLIVTNENKIQKVISLKKDAEAIAIKGKHMGKEGKIKELVKEGENNLAILITPNKEEVKINIESLFLKP